MSKLRKLRLDNNLTQDSMAKLIGLKRQTYAHKENGIRAVSLDEAEIISDLFGLKVEDIFFDKKAT